MIFPSVTYIIWCWRPLCSCDIKPTALPSKCKEKAWRKASNKKAIALACHAQANVARWIKCKKWTPFFAHFRPSLLLRSDWTSGPRRRSRAHSHGFLHRWVRSGMWDFARTAGQLPLKETVARRTSWGCARGRGHPRDGCYLSFAGSLWSVLNSVRGCLQAPQARQMTMIRRRHRRVEHAEPSLLGVNFQESECIAEKKKNDRSLNMVQQYGECAHRNA